MTKADAPKLAVLVPAIEANIETTGKAGLDGNSAEILTPPTPVAGLLLLEPFQFPELVPPVALTHIKEFGKSIATQIVQGGDIVPLSICVEVILPLT